MIYSQRIDFFISLTFLHFVVEIKATQILYFSYSGKIKFVKKYLFKEYINFSAFCSK